MTNPTKIYIWIIFVWIIRLGANVPPLSHPHCFLLAINQASSLISAVILTLLCETSAWHGAIALKIRLSPFPKFLPPAKLVTFGIWRGSEWEKKRYLFIEWICLYYDGKFLFIVSIVFSPDFVYMYMRATGPCPLFAERMVSILCDLSVTFRRMSVHIRGVCNYSIRLYGVIIAWIICRFL